MLKVQSFLSGFSDYQQALQSLESKYGIKNRVKDDLVILNYDQIDSNKQEEIVRECRGLVLKLNTWELVARSFSRFFNAGEFPALEKKFDWDNFTCESKEDGSLIVCYYYNNQWNINTRGSFAEQEVSNGCGFSWQEAVLEKCSLKHKLEELKKDYTYIFEYCSPYNKVVRNYPQHTLFLLSAFHTQSGREENDFILDKLWLRPEKYYFNNLDEIINYLENQDDATFEGLVLRDKNGMRLKVKNSRYVNLHHLADNGNVVNPKRLIPLILKNEHEEVASYFPEILPKVFDLSEKIGGLRNRMNVVWDFASKIEKQKDFAIFVNSHVPKLASVLFNARKLKEHPNQIFNKSEDLLVKILVE